MYQLRYPKAVACYKKVTNRSPWIAKLTNVNTCIHVAWVLGAAQAQATIPGLNYGIGVINFWWGVWKPKKYSQKSIFPLNSLLRFNLELHVYIAHQTV